MTEVLIVKKKQSFDLLCKSMDWFLYDWELVMKELKTQLGFYIT